MQPNNAEKNKKVIGAIRERVNSYFSSQAYGAYKNMCDAVNDAIHQKYRDGEQTTRSGFYLATMGASYEAMLDSFATTYGLAKPLFIADPKKMQSEGMASKLQTFANHAWDGMGEDKTGGLSQWMQVARDVPLYTMGVAYIKWTRYGGIYERPTKSEAGAWGSFLSFSPEYQVLLNGPEIERIHPLRWFGFWSRGEKLPWEGCLREYSLSDVAMMVGDDNYDQEAVKALMAKLTKSAGSKDQNYHDTWQETNSQGKRNTVTVYEYWGDLQNCAEYEKDSKEYCVICTDDAVLRFQPNLMYGFRPFVRVRSNPQNDMPFGRGILTPNMAHLKIQNLMVNLGIDDVVTRMHNGWAVWERYVKNVDDFANPEGTNGIVYMADDAPAEKLPRRIGGESSGILKDMMNINELTEVDRQAAGFTNQQLGLGGGVQGNTATEARLREVNGNRKLRGAIVNMALTGLVPSIRRIVLLSIRNTNEIERSNLTYDGKPFSITNDEAIQIWDNNLVDIHDSVLNDPVEESTNLAEFLNVAKDVLIQMQDPTPMMNMIKDIGRKKRLNVDKYFPEALPPQVGQAPQPQAMPPQMGDVPEDLMAPTSMPTESSLEGAYA